MTPSQRPWGPGPGGLWDQNSILSYFGGDLKSPPISGASVTSPCSFPARPGPRTRWEGGCPGAGSGAGPRPGPGLPRRAPPSAGPRPASTRSTLPVAYGALRWAPVRRTPGATPPAGRCAFTAEETEARGLGAGFPSSGRGLVCPPPTPGAHQQVWSPPPSGLPFPGGNLTEPGPEAGVERNVPAPTRPNSASARDDGSRVAGGGRGLGLPELPLAQAARRQLRLRACAAAPSGAGWVPRSMCVLASSACAGTGCQTGSAAEATVATTMAGTGPPPGLPGAGGALPSGPGPGVPGKSGEERLKEMEAEMALFEQEVLGAPMSGIPAPVVPAVEPAPVIRPIIATNTYQQVQQSLEARAAAAATVIAPIVGPPGPFVGPVGFGPGGDRGRLDSPEARDAMFLRRAVPPQRPPILRPAFVPHVLQRAAGGPRPMALRPPHQALVGPPLPGPPGPPMMLPPMARAPGPPLGTMATLRPPPEEPPAPRELGLGLGLGLKEKEEAAAVAVAAAAAAGLEEAGAAVGGPGAAAVIGPSLPLPLAMPLPEPEPLPLPLEVVRGLLPPLRIPELLSLRPRPRPRPEPQPPPGLMALEVPEPLGEDKKKGKPEKLKRCIRTAAGSSWEDPSLLEWDADDFRIFCGDLGNEVNDDILARAFSRFPSFLKAKVIRDKRTGKTKGYGFVSFKDPSDYVRAMREMNGKYVGSRPIKLRKSMWKDRNLDVVRKKQKEKKKLGLR